MARRATYLGKQSIGSVGKAQKPDLEHGDTVKVLNRGSQISHIRSLKTGITYKIPTNLFKFHKMKPVLQYDEDDDSYMTGMDWEYWMATD